MKPFFQLEKQNPPKTRRGSDTSFMKQNMTIDGPAAVEAYQDILNFLHNNKDLNIKTALDAMAGKGVMSSYLLQIRTLEELTLNDFAEDCYQYLQKKFERELRIKAVLNRDFFHMDLSSDFTRKGFDLVVIDFNNFTWNKKDLVEPFQIWLDRNRKRFTYLMYCDSFYYSLKFMKDASQREEKYQAYLQRTQTELDMKLLKDHVYKSKSCSLLLLKN
jgi:hypothetical protein